MGFLCFICFVTSVGASAIARQNSLRSVQRRNALAKKQRSRLLATRFTTTKAPREAQHAVPVDADRIASTFCGTYYFKLEWNVFGRSWRIKALEVGRQRFLVKVTSLSSENCYMKKQIHPVNPRKWHHLVPARGPCELKAEDAESAVGCLPSSGNILRKRYDFG